MIIVLDNAKVNRHPRRSLLEKYIEKGIIGPDALILQNEFSYVPDFEPMIANGLPEGFQDWKEFGAPKGAPGQNSWHFSLRKHELLAWVLAVYFIQSLEEAVKHDSIFQTYKKSELIPPMTKSQFQKTSFLFGESSLENESQYKMNQIHCRTSFQPNLQKNLKDIIVNGLASSLPDDILQPRPTDSYTQGWVLDVGDLERKTKNKLTKYGGLGYIDLKTAYYGTPQSHSLTLFLPIEEKLTSTKIASHYFKNVVLCQVNEKRTDQECHLDQNLKIHANHIPLQTTLLQFPGSLYLGKPLCIHASIPEEVLIAYHEKKPGLFLDVFVEGDNVSVQNGACSISHVIWELQS